MQRKKHLAVDWKEQKRTTSCVSALLQNGVVHRDLKLENILLDQDLNVKVSMLKHTVHNLSFISLFLKKHNHACFGKINSEFPSTNHIFIPG